MLLPIKKIALLNTIDSVSRLFGDLSGVLTDRFLDQIVTEEPTEIIKTLATKAAKEDSKTWVLLKDNVSEATVAVEVSIDHFVVINNKGNYDVTPCISKANQQAMFKEIVKGMCLSLDYNRKFFGLETNDYTDEHAERFAKQLEESEQVFIKKVPQ